MATFNERSFYSIILFLNTVACDLAGCGSSSGSDLSGGSDINATGRTGTGTSSGSTRFYDSAAVQQLRCEPSSGRWTSDSNLARAEVPAVQGRALVFHQSLVHEGVAVDAMVEVVSESAPVPAPDHAPAPAPAPTPAPARAEHRNLIRKYILRSDLMFRRTPALCDSDRDRAAYELYRQGELAGERGDVEASVALMRRAFKMSPDLQVAMGQ